MKFNRLNSYFIKAVKASLNGEVLSDPPENFDWVRFYNLCKFHGMISTVYFALKTNENVPKKVVSKFEEGMLVVFAKQTAESIELKKLEKQFFEKNISLLYLKGAVIRKYYPKAEMRASSDIDIFVKSEDIDSAKAIMLENGYDCKYDGVNEVVFKKPPLINIEIHKTFLSPITSVGKVYTYDFSAGVNKYNNVFVMSDNDLYIHTFLHIVQHMEDGGIGVRFFTDMYLLRKKLTIDKDYVSKKLKDFGVYDFYLHAVKLTDMWFENSPPNEITLKFADFVINSGAYGTNINSSINKVSEENGKDLLIKRLFPKKEIIAFRYPDVLTKPYELPFYWIKRFFEVKNPAEKLKVTKEQRKQLTAQDIKSQKELLRDIGLFENKN